MDVPEVDVMINTIFTNHQCDPLQFLSYICDRARKGIFLWVLIEENVESCSVIYPSSPPHDILDTERPFPLYFNNHVRMSQNMLLLTLRRLGFGECEIIPPFKPSDKWNMFQDGFRMYYATRTSNVKSAYWPMRQDTPAEQTSKKCLWSKLKKRITAKICKLYGRVYPK